jgi:hypothetical protein
LTAAGTSPAAALTIGPYSVMVLSQTPLNPALSITGTNRTGIINWPAAYAAWTLQSAANLAGNPAAWKAVPATQYQTNTPAISVTITQTGAGAFYRLSQN